MSEYRPGVCNIGRAERRKRRVAGAAGFAAAAALVAWVVLTGRPTEWLLGVFPFAFAGFVGLFQDHFRFCVAFGALARYDLSGSGGDAGRVAEREAIRRDRRRALQLLAYATAAAVALTAAVYAAASLV